MDEEYFSCPIYSFTKKESKLAWVKKKYLQKGETVLIVDDFLADGSAVLGLCNIVEQAGCKVGGIGVAIEKSFLSGAKKIKKAGYRLESLARIKSLEDEGIEFM
jgi:xanthine phosphoribosyltransferase